MYTDLNRFRSQFLFSFRRLSVTRFDVEVRWYSCWVVLGKIRRAKPSIPWLFNLLHCWTLFRGCWDIRWLQYCQYERIRSQHWLKQISQKSKVSGFLLQFEGVSWSWISLIRHLSLRSHRYLDSTIAATVMPTLSSSSWIQILFRIEQIGPFSSTSFPNVHPSTSKEENIDGHHTNRTEKMCDENMASWFMFWPYSWIWCWKSSSPFWDSTEVCYILSISRINSIWTFSHTWWWSERHVCQRYVWYWSYLLCCVFAGLLNCHSIWLWQRRGHSIRDLANFTEDRKGYRLTRDLSTCSTPKNDSSSPLLSLHPSNSASKQCKSTQTFRKKSGSLPGEALIFLLSTLCSWSTPPQANSFTSQDG